LKLASSSLVFSNVEASCSSAITQGETRTAHKSGECTMAQLYKKILPLRSCGMGV